MFDKGPILAATSKAGKASANSPYVVGVESIGGIKVIVSTWIGAGYVCPGRAIPMESER